MERDGEVLLYPGVPDRKSRLRCPLRGSIADDPFGTFASASRLGGLRPVLPLGLLSGGGVPRDSANGARAAVWSAARDSHQQLSLHFRSLTFLSLLAHFSGSPHIRGHFAIGLFFSVLFWRSGNLWMVAIFHGIGNSYIDGTQQR